MMNEETLHFCEYCEREFTQDSMYTGTVTVCWDIDICQQCHDNFEYDTWLQIKRDEETERLNDE